VFSQRRRSNSALAAICIGLVWGAAGCIDRDAERPGPSAERLENSSSKWGASRNETKHALAIQELKEGAIDHHWPRRVANIVGFAPPDIDEDYTAQFMARPRSRAVGETLYVVRRRGNWVRIDEHFEGRITACFINLSTETVVHIDGGVPSRQSAYMTVEPLQKELWNGSGRQISLKREALADAEVMPPVHLFDLRMWTSAISLESDVASYSVLLEQDGGDVAGTRDVNAARTVLIERRRGSLWSQELISQESHTFSTSDDRGTFQFGATYTPDGRLIRLSVTVSARPRHAQSSTDLGQTEVVLGETCRWEDNAPGVADATWMRCLATDGAPLIDVTGGWGRSTRLTAVNIGREPLPVDAFFPPSAAFSALMPLFNSARPTSFAEKPD
jgi:hypothetical protein